MTSKCNSKIYICICFIYHLRRFLVKRKVFPTSFDLAAIFKGYLYLSNLQKTSLFDVINRSDVIRGRSKSPEFYMRKVKGYLRYKTISCHKVALNAQLMNFVI